MLAGRSVQQISMTQVAASVAQYNLTDGQLAVKLQMITAGQLWSAKCNLITDNCMADWLNGGVRTTGVLYKSVTTTTASLLWRLQTSPRSTLESQDQCD
jgi:hypothetical protein